jgi:hypothetical protein
MFAGAQMGRPDLVSMAINIPPGHVLAAAIGPSVQFSRALIAGGPFSCD